MEKNVELWNPFKKPTPVIKDLGSVVKLNREREKAREFEKHAPMFNEMLNDIQVQLCLGKNFVEYPYSEERLLCVNATRNSFKEWGKRHNLHVYVYKNGTKEIPTITISLVEIR